MQAYAHRFRAHAPAYAREEVTTRPVGSVNVVKEVGRGAFAGLRAPAPCPPHTHVRARVKEGPVGREIELPACCTSRVYVSRGRVTSVTQGV